MLGSYLELVPPLKANTDLYLKPDDPDQREAAKIVLERLEQDEMFEACAILRDYLKGCTDEKPPKSLWDRKAIFAQLLLVDIGYYLKLK